MPKEDKLTKKQEKELQQLTNEITKLATEVVIDYEKIPSKASGSIIEINENSPYLYDWLEEDQWKRVLTQVPIVDKKDATE